MPITGGSAGMPTANILPGLTGRRRELKYVSEFTNRRDAWRCVMANKESKEIVKPEPSRVQLPYWEWRDVDKWMDEVFRRPFSLAGLPRMKVPELQEFNPSVDIFEDNSDVVLKAELPGMKKEDIDIRLTQDTITISGEKKKEEKIEKKDYHRWECVYGSFTRSFSLPADIQMDKVKSQFKDGILEVRMPKTETAKMKEIKVKVE
jgi:HSP20 family protein